MGAAKKSAKGRKKSTAKRASARSGSKKTQKKTAAKKSSAKKATKRATGKKTTAKKASSRSKATKKTTRKKTATKKTATKKTSRKKAVAKKQPRPRRPKKVNLSKEFLAETKERLIAERAELQRQLQEIEQDAAAESEDTGQHEDFADAGTTTFERERDLSIRNNVLDLIDQVTRALDRLEEGKYGSCESCGQPIAVARIKAFPRVLMCLDCKRRDERTR